MAGLRYGALRDAASNRTAYDACGPARGGRGGRSATLRVHRLARLRLQRVLVAHTGARRVLL